LKLKLTNKMRDDYCIFAGLIFVKTKSLAKMKKTDAEETILNIGLFNHRSPLKVFRVRS